MKKIATVLILCLLLSPVCLAESSADQFLSGLSDAWNGLVGMVSDAGNSISQWAEDSGIAPWIRGAAEYYLQQFKDSGDVIAAEGLGAFSAEEMKSLAGRIRPVVPTVKLRGVDEAEK